MRYIKNNNWTIREVVDGALVDLTENATDDAEESVANYITIDSDTGDAYSETMFKKSKTPTFEVPPEIDNVISLAEDELDELDENIDRFSTELRKSLLNFYASGHIAFDNASAQTTAVLRDHLKIEGNIDDSFIPVLNTVGTLEVLSSILSQSSMGEDRIASVFDKLSTKIVSDMVSVKGSAYSKYSSKLENMGLGVAIGGSGTQIDTKGVKDGQKPRD